MLALHWRNVTFDVGSMLVRNVGAISKCHVSPILVKYLRVCNQCCQKYLSNNDFQYVANVDLQ